MLYIMKLKGEQNMKFFTQTAFALAVIGFILSIKDCRKKQNIVLFVISIILLMAYTVPYLYLLFKGELNWMKTAALIVVICFSIISIRRYSTLK